jgi:hypothetical protein
MSCQTSAQNPSKMFCTPNANNLKAPSPFRLEMSAKYTIVILLCLPFKFSQPVPKCIESEETMKARLPDWSVSTVLQRETKSVWSKWIKELDIFFFCPSLTLKGFKIDPSEGIHPINPSHSLELKDEWNLSSFIHRTGSRLPWSRNCCLCWDVDTVTSKVTPAKL